MVVDTLASHEHRFDIAVHNVQVLHMHKVELSINGQGRLARLVFLLMHPLEVEHVLFELQILDRKLGMNLKSSLWSCL